MTPKGTIFLFFSQKGGATGREQDNSRESLLYFEGPLEVQGLFEYLFNEGRRVCGEECDVPLLMAPVPFPAACLKHLHPKVTINPSINSTIRGLKHLHTKVSINPPMNSTVRGQKRLVTHHISWPKSTRQGISSLISACCHAPRMKGACRHWEHSCLEGAAYQLQLETVPCSFHGSTVADSKLGKINATTRLCDCKCQGLRRGSALGPKCPRWPLRPKDHHRLIFLSFIFCNA